MSHTANSLTKNVTKSSLAADKNILVQNCQLLRNFFSSLYNTGDIVVISALDEKVKEKPSRGDIFYHVGFPILDTISWCSQKQAEGFGLFFMVNPSNGSTKQSREPDRSKTGVKTDKLQHIWLDLDGGMKDYNFFTNENCKPFYILNSSKKDDIQRVQILWKIDKYITEQEQVKIHKEIIAKYGGDEHCHNINRLMRLPLSVHNKREPQETSFLSRDFLQADYDEFKKTFLNSNHNVISVESNRNVISVESIGEVVDLKPTKPESSDNDNDDDNEDKKKSTASTYLPGIVAHLANLEQGNIESGTNKLLYCFFSAFPDSIFAIDKIAKALTVSGVETVDTYKERIKKIYHSAREKPADNPLAFLRILHPKCSTRLKVKGFIDLKYSEKLWWDVLTSDVMSGEKTLSDIEQNNYYSEDFESLDCNREMYREFLMLAAQRNCKNRITDYVNTLNPEKADTTNLPAISRLQRNFSCTTELEKEMLQKFLVSLIARAVSPGAKVDTSLILVGTQGLNKTQAWQALVPNGLFLTTKAEVNPVDELLTFRQAWLVEMGEIETIYTKKGIAQLKSFMSERVDRYRSPYGRAVESHRRQFVMCGSSNRDDFLCDSTGSRRFWVLNPKGEIDIQEIEKDRDDIFSEALALYNSGYKWWGDKHFEALVNENNLDYTEQHPLETQVSRFISSEGSQGFEVNTLALKLQIDDKSIKEKRVLCEILRKLGCEKKRQTISGHRAEYWYPQGEILRQELDQNLLESLNEGETTKRFNSITGDYEEVVKIGDKLISKVFVDRYEKIETDNIQFE